MKGRSTLLSEVCSVNFQWSEDDASLTSSVALTKERDLPKPVAKLIDAINRGDVLAFLSLFPNDGIVEDRGRYFKGHTEIRRWHELELTGKRDSIVINQVGIRGCAVTVVATLASRSAEGRFRFNFVIDNVDVCSMRICEDR